ncbi:MAG TPA: ATP-binding protein [Burkholderiaceae bacterium]|nr:ATP-binding protein [Burkholderiaceae bacterium]
MPASTRLPAAQSESKESLTTPRSRFASATTESAFRRTSSNSCSTCSSRPEPGVGEHQGGLGIGLSMVRRLVELHGGTVKAESAGRGNGATFIVRLPRMTRRAISA